MAGVTEGVPAKELYEERWCFRGYVLVYHDAKDVRAEGAVRKRGLEGPTRLAGVEAAATSANLELVNVLVKDLHICHLRTLIIDVSSS